MKNAVIYFISILCFTGCQSVADNGSAVSHPSTPGNLMAKTVKYFKPLMPEKEPGKTFAKNEDTVSGSSEVPPRPVEYKTAARHPLYKAGSILPSKTLVDEQFFTDVSSDMSASIGGSDAVDIPAQKTLPKLELKPERQPDKKSAKDILQARKSDSEALRQLLGEITAVPKEEWKIEEHELAELIETFRSSMDWDEEPELELRYLAAVRRKVLPVKKSVKTAEEKSEEDGAVEADFSTYQSRTRKNKTAPPASVKQESESEASTPLPSRPPVSGNAAAVPPPAYPNIPQLSNVQPVVPASYVAPISDISRQTASADTQYGQYGADWEATARIAAEQLRQKIEQTPTGRTFGNEAKLRLLELALNHRSEAAKSFSSMEKPFNEFWGNQMLGLAALLDETGMPDTKVRYAGAAFRFDEGLMELRKVCPVKLKNVRFVRDIQAFGFYLPRSEDCKPGETLEVYMELENPTVRRTGQGYNVGVSMSYEIRDATGNVLEKVNNIAVDCTTPGPRRDHFVNLRVTLPRNLQTGSYQLRINVTDTNNESLDYTEEQIPFKIVPSADAPAAGRPGTKPTQGE